MRSNKKTQAGRVWYAWTGSGGKCCWFYDWSTHGENKRDGQWEESRSEGLVSLQSQPVN